MPAAGRPPLVVGVQEIVIKGQRQAGVRNFGFTSVRVRAIEHVGVNRYQALHTWLLPFGLFGTKNPPSTFSTPHRTNTVEDEDDDEDEYEPLAALLLVKGSGPT